MTLDDATAIARVDPSDALGAVERTAQQWAEAMRRAHAADVPAAREVTNVVFCGMGGSGIAGDVLAAVGAGAARVPILVLKGYTLPAYVGPASLVICASYSGNTEETLACYDEARARGATIAAITTGGALAERAASHGVPLVSPVEGLQPRAALASLAVPAIVMLQRAGLLDDVDADLAEAETLIAARAKELGRDAPDNEAKRLARALDGKLPVVWGQAGFLEVAAVRWRSQLNENAKIPAYSAVLPELNHNDIVGYDPGVEALRDVAIVVLRAPGEHPRVAKRIDATLDAMRDRVGLVTEAWGAGSSVLARLMTVTMLGDFASVYLAVLRGVDPTPVKVIEALKKRLAG